MVAPSYNRMLFGRALLTDIVSTAAWEAARLEHRGTPQRTIGHEMCAKHVVSAASVQKG